jgi:hypothetical protein
LDLTDDEFEPPYNPFQNFRSELVDNRRVDVSGAAPVRGLEGEKEK